MLFKWPRQLGQNKIWAAIKKYRTSFIMTQRILFSSYCIATVCQYRLYFFIAAWITWVTQPMLFKWPRQLGQNKIWAAIKKYRTSFIVTLRILFSSYCIATICQYIFYFFIAAWITRVPQPMLFNWFRQLGQKIWAAIKKYRASFIITLRILFLSYCIATICQYRFYFFIAAWITRVAQPMLFKWVRQLEQKKIKKIWASIKKYRVSFIITHRILFSFTIVGQSRDDKFGRI